MSSYSCCPLIDVPHHKCDIFLYSIIVYDHKTRDIGDKLTDFAHEFHHLVISTMHVHLTHSSCLEVVAVKGPGESIRKFSDKLISIKGVKHGKLVITGLVEDSTE